MVFRVYVEKKPGLDNEARGLLNDAHSCGGAVLRRGAALRQQAREGHGEQPDQPVGFEKGEDN